MPPQTQQDTSFLDKYKAAPPASDTAFLEKYRAQPSAPPPPGLGTEATSIGRQKPPPSLSQGPTSHEPLISLLTQRNYTPEGRREHPVLSWIGEHTKNLGQTLEPGANAAALLFAGPGGIPGGPSTGLERPTAPPRIAPQAPPRIAPPVLGAQPKLLGTSEPKALLPSGPAESPRGYFNLGRGKPSPSIDEVVNQATGVKPLQPNVPLREQLSTPPPAGLEPVDPIKAKYPDPNVRQMVRANGEQIYEAAKGDPATVKAIHDLTRVDLRQALVNAGEDMGQMTVSNSKFAGQGSISREEAFNRLLAKGLKPNDIVRLAKAPSKQ